MMRSQFVASGEGKVSWGSNRLFILIFITLYCCVGIVLRKECCKPKLSFTITGYMHLFTAFYWCVCFNWIVAIPLLLFDFTFSWLVWFNWFDWIATHWWNWSLTVRSVVDHLSLNILKHASHSIRHVCFSYLFHFIYFRSSVFLMVCFWNFRVPFEVVQTDDWDCSCLLPHDPFHADCAVPQVIFLSI